MRNSNFLHATGLLEGYENVIFRMINEGWPDGVNLYNHAAYLLLEYQTDNSERLSEKYSSFRNRVKLREQTGAAYLKGTSSDPNIQTYGSTLALRNDAADARLGEAASRVSLLQQRSVFGEKLPVKLQLKSKRQSKFKENPLDVSIFEGILPLALTRTKPNEAPSADLRKFQTNLGLDYRSTGSQHGYSGLDNYKSMGPGDGAHNQKESNGKQLDGSLGNYHSKDSLGTGPGYASIGKN